VSGSARLSYEEMSPYKLLRNLPAFAGNKVPPDIAAAFGDEPVPAWKLLEEAVFYFFRSVLMFETQRLGAESLFRHEPEGLVLNNRDPEPFALMYECKSNGGGYRMSSDDALRYKDYLRIKRADVFHRHNLRLTHMIIVASTFHGDVEKRLQDIGGDGTVLCLLPAEQLLQMYNRITGLDFPDIQLLRLRQLFCRGVVGESHVGSCFRT
jgi:hypothetical protein